MKQLNVSGVSDRYYQIGAEFVKKIYPKGLIRYPQIVHPFAKLWIAHPRRLDSY